MTEWWTLADGMLGLSHRLRMTFVIWGSTRMIKFQYVCMTEVSEGSDGIRLSILPLFGHRNWSGQPSPDNELLNRHRITKLMQSDYAIRTFCIATTRTLPRILGIQWIGSLRVMNMYKIRSYGVSRFIRIHEYTWTYSCKALAYISSSQIPWHSLVLWTWLISIYLLMIYTNCVHVVFFCTGVSDWPNKI